MAVLAAAYRATTAQAMAIQPHAAHVACLLRMAMQVDHRLHFEGIMADLREQAWTLATDTPLPSGGDEEVIERVYGLVGDESLDGLGIATPPQVSELADAALARFLQSDQGKDFIAAAAAAQDQQPQP